MTFQNDVDAATGNWMQQNLLSHRIFIAKRGNTGLFTPTSSQMGSLIIDCGLCLIEIEGWPSPLGVQI